MPTPPILATVTAAADPPNHDEDKLRNYWLHGAGAKRWATWTQLYRHLKKHVDAERAKRIAASWFHLRYGFWPGDHRNESHAEEAHVTAAPGDTPTRVEVREATTGGATPTPTGRLLIRLIRAGWSANGNLYTAEVLRRAAAERMYPAGTLCYADHATDEEDATRPSGSIKNLAGVLETDARWDEGEQSLFAEARLFTPWRDPILDMAESIGMSIRAWVVGGHGERDGRSGFVVEQIVGGRSVDFVTVPAAGGGIVTVLEAVGNTVPVQEARNCGNWFEAQIHSGFTGIADRMFGDGYLTRDERIGLSSAIGDALDAFSSRLTADYPNLYSRDPWQEPEPTEPTAAAEAVSASDITDPDDGSGTDVTGGTPPPDPNNTSDEEEPAMSGTQTGGPPEQAGTAPVPDGGQTPTTPAAPPAAPELAQESAATAALAALNEQLAAVQRQLAVFAERDAQRDATERRARNESAARDAVTAAVNGPDVPAPWRNQIAPRVTATVLTTIPTGESGDVDPARLIETVRAAVEAELTHCRTIQAQALEEAGVGLPTGLGSTTQESPVDDGLDAELNALFEGSLGLPTKAVEIAVKGRG